MRIDLDIMLQRRFEQLARSYATKPNDLARMIVESWTLDAGHGHPVLYSGMTAECRQKRMARADGKSTRELERKLANDATRRARSALTIGALVSILVTLAGLWQFEQAYVGYRVESAKFQQFLEDDVAHGQREGGM